MAEQGPPLPPRTDELSLSEPGVDAPDAERRTVVVDPEDVWPPPGNGAAGSLGPEPAQHTFAAPILLVTGLSAALLALLIALVALVLWLRR